MAKDFKIEIDRKVLEGLEKRLQDLNQKEIQYGYFDKVYPVGTRAAGIPVATVAFWHEHGLAADVIAGPTQHSVHYPARPFFTFSIKKAEQIVKNIAPVIYSLSFLGKLEKRLLQVGETLKATVQESIDEADQNGFPPLAPSTVKRKKSDIILRETDTLYDSVEAKIVNTDAYGSRKKEVDI